MQGQQRTFAGGKRGHVRARARAPRRPRGSSGSSVRPTPIPTAIIRTKAGEVLGRLFFLVLYGADHGVRQPTLLVAEEGPHRRRHR